MSQLLDLVVRTYEPDEQVQIRCLVRSARFTCLGCQRVMTATHAVMADGGWTRTVCDGCNGYLLNEQLDCPR